MDLIEKNLMRPIQSMLLCACLAGLASCTTSLREDLTYGSRPSLGFSGPRIQVNGVSYETSYSPEVRNDQNVGVLPHDGVGILCEDPRQSGYSLKGPGDAGIFRGDQLEFTLKSEDGSKDLGRQLLRSGDVILIPSGSIKPVFISRNWSPPKGARTSKILSEFRRIIAEYQARERSKANL